MLANAAEIQLIPGLWELKAHTIITRPNGRVTETEALTNSICYDEEAAAYVISSSKRMPHDPKCVAKPPLPGVMGYEAVCRRGRQVQYIKSELHATPETISSEYTTITKFKGKTTKSVLVENGRRIGECPDGSRK